MKYTQRILLAGILVFATMVCGSRFVFAQTGTSSISASASEDVPRTISYQGVVRSDDGTLVSGFEPMTIRLYADSIGATLVWEDTFSVNAHDGIFNLMLGSQKPLPAAAQMGVPLWVAVKIGEAGELKPYAPLTASPYALTVANGSITAEKMATDYVGSLSINGTQVTGKGSNVNLMAGDGLTLSYDPVSSAVWLSASGNGGSTGKGAQLQANRVWTFNGRKDDVVSVSGDYSFSQISGNMDLSSQVSNTLGISHGGTGASTTSANKVFAGPSSGGNAAPSFRSLAASDIPTLNQNTTGTASNVTGIVALANGGTGVTNASGVAQSAFFGGPSSGGAGAASFRAIVAGDIPTLNQNTTGTASNVTGIVALANGGTGVTNASGVAQSAFFGGPSGGGAGAASFRAIVPGDIPTLNQNTTGTASNVTGTVAIDHGGTGATTATANKVFAGPSSGGAAAPSFRSLVAADIPTLDQNTTGTAANVTGTVAVAHGGTGVTTTAANKVFAGPSSGGNAAPSFRTLAAGDIPTLNQNTTGTASNVTGIVALANGGTGVTNASGVAQAAFFGGPSNGGAGAASYRSIVPSDVPTLNQNTTGTAANVTGIVAVVNGGTGVTTTAANMVFAGPVSGSNAAPSFRVLDTSDIPSLVTRYIANGVSQQSNASFNVDGSGQVGTTLTAGGNINTTGGAYQWNGTTILVEDGSANLYVGASAGVNNTSGYYNLFSGMDAGKNNSDGFENTFLGTGSGYENTDGTNNMFSGTKSGFTNSTGSYNTFIGGLTGYNNTTGTNNTFLGNGVGPTNQSGDDITLLGFNTDVGSDGLTDATAIGDGAIVDSSYTIQLGDDSITTVTTSGSFNTTGGSFEIGGKPVFTKSGTRNLFVGAGSGAGTTGGYNTFTGDSVGTSNTTGANNTLLGYGANVGSSSLTNATAIGSGAVVSASNTIQLGNSSVTKVNTSGSLVASGSLTTGGHIIATSSATAASANGGVIVSDVPVFVISAGTATANFSLTMPAGSATGDMIVVINQNASHSATFGTTASVAPLGSRIFYYDGTSWQ